MTKDGNNKCPPTGEQVNKNTVQIGLALEQGKGIECSEKEATE